MLYTIHIIIMEIEEILNDHPLTNISSDIKDPKPITLAHLLYGRIVLLPYHNAEKDRVDDPDYEAESAVIRE